MSDGKVSAPDLCINKEIYWTPQV